MYGISARGSSSYVIPSSLGEGLGKNVTLFSYMVMQHTAHLLENLSPYTGTLVYASAPVEVSIAYTALWELRNYRATGAPRMDSESPAVEFPRSLEIYSRVLRMNTILPRGTTE